MCEHRYIHVISIDYLNFLIVLSIAITSITIMEHSVLNQQSMYMLFFWSCSFYSNPNDLISTSLVVLAIHV